MKEGKILENEKSRIRFQLVNPNQINIRKLESKSKLKSSCKTKSSSKS